MDYLENFNEDNIITNEIDWGGLAFAAAIQILAGAVAYVIVYVIGI